MKERKTRNAGMNPVSSLIIKKMVKTSWNATVVLTESCVTTEIDGTVLRGCPRKS